MYKEYGRIFATSYGDIRIVPGRNLYFGNIKFDPKVFDDVNNLISNVGQLQDQVKYLQQQIDDLSK